MPIDLSALIYRMDRSPAPSAAGPGELSGPEFDGNTLIFAVALALLEAEKLSIADAVDIDTEVTPTTGDKFVLYRGGVPRLGDVGNLPASVGGGGVVGTIAHDGAGANPTTGDTITLTFAPGYSGDVQWQRAGVDIGGATGNTYTLVSADAIQALTPVISNLVYTPPAITAAPEAAVPQTFDTGDWSVLGATSLNIITLPTSIPALTDIEYDINGSGTPISLAGTAADVYAIAALTSGDTVRVRGVNSVGPGAWSALKTYTASSGLSIVQNPASVITGYGAGVTVNFASALTDTNGGVVVVRIAAPDAAPASVIDDDGQAWGLVGTLSVGDSAFRVYARMNVSGGPVNAVTVTFAGSMPGAAKAMEVAGGGSSLTVDQLVDSIAQGTDTLWPFNFTTSVPSTLALACLNLTSSDSLGTPASPFTIHDMGATYDQLAVGILPSTGVNSTNVDFTPSGRNGTKATLVLRPGV